MPKTPAASRLVRRTATAPRAIHRSTRQEFADACLPHQHELYGVGLRMTRSNADALDLVQETLMRAMLAWERFEKGSNVRAWLLRILTNTFINGYRKRRRHQKFATECPGDARAAFFGTTEDTTGDLEDAIVEGELGDEVSGALERLSPDYRDVVERADLRGEKYKDIAEATGVPIGTVMSRLFRARRQLETELEAYAEEDWGIKRAA